MVHEGEKKTQMHLFQKKHSHKKEVTSISKAGPGNIALALVQFDRMYSQ